MRAQARTQGDGEIKCKKVNARTGACTVLGYESVSLFVLGYHWLPQATIDLVGDSREFEVWAIFWGHIPIISGW